MIKADQYLRENLTNIMMTGCLDENPRPKYKDGTPAHSKFITQVFEKYDISKGEFPIPTLRNTAIKTGIKEIMWIYQEQDNKLSSAREYDVNWWDEWDIGDGSIGNRYGYTVRKYNLINNLLNDLKHNSYSRRHIINLYQYQDLNETKGLYPCAFETMWSIRNVGGEIYLDMTLNQRSSDFITAGYINKIQYVALQMMIAGHLEYKVGKFAHFVQNLHVYDRHYNAVNELLDREPIEVQPKIELIGNKDFYEYDIEDFKITNNVGTKLTSPFEIAI